MKNYTVIFKTLLQIFGIQYKNQSLKITRKNLSIWKKEQNLLYRYRPWAISMVKISVQNAGKPHVESGLKLFDPKAKEGVT